MTRPLTIMLCAGEPSGDVLGGELMRELKAMRPDVRLIGVGGAAMTGEGLVSYFGIADLAVMGIREVVPKMRLLFRRMKQVADFALRTRPDVVVLIDSGDFNHRVARRIRAADPSIRIVKYVSAQVWASRPGRAAKMKSYLDLVLCLLPFEPAFYEQHGVPAVFVGHPAVARARQAIGGAALRARLGIATDAKLLCVLPGSRRFEVRHLLPEFKKAVADLARAVPDLVCILPTVANAEPHVRRLSGDWPTPLHIVMGDADKFAAFDAATAAAAASGTVVIELAVAGVPMIAAYDLGWLTSRIWKRLITVKFMTIVNLVLDRLAIPEFVEAMGHSKAIASVLLPLLNDPAAASRQKTDLAEAVRRLGSAENASRNAAEQVLRVAERR